MNNAHAGPIGPIGHITPAPASTAEPAPAPMPGAAAFASPADAALLEQAWRDPPGWLGAISAVNHKTISLRFMLATFAFFVAGGVLALLVRLQLAQPSSTLIGADRYNQLFTMHGTTMMFLFAVPVMQAIAIYLVPLMIGARSVAFPRMNAFAFWIFVFGGVMLYVAFLFDTGADAGWFAYVPLSSIKFSPEKRVDFWAQMITFTEVSGMMEAIVLITTIFKMRAPGMTLNRMPLFVWGVLVTSVMVLFALPAVVLASTALITDRLVDTRFYSPEHGGDVLLWQHLFWFFGHPEVYLIFIPPLGFISSIIATFARRPVVGYRAMVLALIATGFLAFGLWVHHMFATDLPPLGKIFFTAASLMIALPTSVQIFCWIATLWSGRLWFRAPLLFVLGFFAILLLGGLTGLMLASVPLDLQLHDTYFVVAHLHYVLLGGAVFPLFGAFYYWFPKFTGRMLSERLGRWQFWLFFIAFNVTFFPMHVLGLMGMPRRVYTYGAEMGWSGLNLISSIGAFGIAASVLLFIINVMHSRRSGAWAGNDPWGAGTLEWSVASPPPAGNFIVVPVVHSRFPLWQPGGAPGYVAGLSNRYREVLITSVADASPEHRLWLPASTPWPFVAAVATTILFVGAIFTPWAVVWGALPVAAACTLWFWPKRAVTAARCASEVAP
jgi:cytochrome c oxidase subunit 1